MRLIINQIRSIGGSRQGGAGICNLALDWAVGTDEFLAYGAVKYVRTYDFDFMIPSKSQSSPHPTPLLFGPPF